jgi:ATP-binding cassette subfamily C protein CydD
MIDQKLIRQARPAGFNLILTMLLGSLAGIIVVGQAFYLSRTINRVFLEGASLADVRPWLAGLFLFGLARAGLVWSSQVTAQRTAGQVKDNLRNMLTDHLLALGPAYTRPERSGELANVLVEGIEALEAYFSQYLPQLAMAALIPLAILTFVFPLDLISGLVLLLTAPLIPLFMILIGSLAKQKTARQWRALSLMSAHFLDMIQGLTTLKVLGRSREQVHVIRLISDRFRQTTMGVLRVAFLSALVLELLATLSVAVIAVEVGLRLLYGYLEFEQALFVLILAPEFYLPLRLLGSRFHAGMSGATAARRIFELLETPLPASTGVVAEEKLALPARPTIQFENVFYAYDQGRRPALNGVSFTLSPGEKVALVGPSGAGKSTITHLLLRFIEPDRGKIRVEGQLLSDLDLSAWRNQLAWVSQRPYLFHGSVLDNIRLACPQATLEQVVQAAQQAQADTFIRLLPQGYDTLIGERGLRLSGGQAQRLALARAFLKDAPLLILDEATANLDPEHEAQIQLALERLLPGRTALMIAHRLNTVYMADKILVMSQGQIVEAGAHHALIHRQGLYHRLVMAYGGAA